MQRSSCSRELNILSLGYQSYSVPLLQVFICQIELIKQVPWVHQAWPLSFLFRSQPLGFLQQMEGMVQLWAAFSFIFCFVDAQSCSVLNGNSGEYSCPSAFPKAFLSTFSWAWQKADRSCQNLGQSGLAEPALELVLGHQYYLIDVSQQNVFVFKFFDL